MQYHVNGFHPGDPDVRPAIADHRRATDPLPQTVDVLIAGSGPAGLCLAAQLARAPVIAFLDDDARADPVWMENIADCFDQFGDAVEVVGGRIANVWFLRP